jgi:hypothetical protein
MPPGLKRMQVPTTPGRAVVQNLYVQPIVARRDDDDFRTRIRCSMGANPKPEKRDQNIAMRAKNS